jgi:hypothetical protein
MAYELTETLHADSSTALATLVEKDLTGRFPVFTFDTDAGEANVSMLRFEIVDGATSVLWPLKGSIVIIRATLTVSGSNRQLTDDLTVERKADQENGDTLRHDILSSIGSWHAENVFAFIPFQDAGAHKTTGASTVAIETNWLQAELLVDGHLWCPVFHVHVPPDPYLHFRVCDQTMPTISGPVTNDTKVVPSNACEPECQLLRKGDTRTESSVSSWTEFFLTNMGER